MSHKPEDFANMPASFKARNAHLFVGSLVGPHYSGSPLDVHEPSKPLISSPTLKAAKIKSQSEKLKDRFLTQWALAHGPELETEYRFHAVRKWRFDYAYVPLKIAIEIEGGIWTDGAHTRGAHFNSDAEKYNEAAMLGWTVFRFTSNMMCPEFIERVARFCLNPFNKS